MVLQPQWCWLLHGHLPAAAGYMLPAAVALVVLEPHPHNQRTALNRHTFVLFFSAVAPQPRSPYNMPTQHDSPARKERRCDSQRRPSEHALHVPGVEILSPTASNRCGLLNIRNRDTGKQKAIIKQPLAEAVSGRRNNERMIFVAS